jgi:hypothetical protein
MKNVKVVLRTNGNGDTFVVVKATNTLRWIPGQNLDKKGAEEMMKAPHVEVTVVGQ